MLTQSLARVESTCFQLPSGPLRFPKRARGLQRFLPSGPARGRVGFLEEKPCFPSQGLRFSCGSSKKYLNPFPLGPNPFVQAPFTALRLGFAAVGF